MSTKKLTIVTVPLLQYKDKIRWGVYQEHTGRVRKEVKGKANAGKQVLYALVQACISGNDILIAVDDKFNAEKGLNEDPDVREVQDFLNAHPLPRTFMEVLAEHGALGKIVHPEMSLACTAYCFSEQKLFKEGRHSHFLGGECATEWAFLMEYVEKRGYAEVEAYIPQVCYKGVCLSTRIVGQKSSVPINLKFTDFKSEGYVQESDLPKALV